MEASCCLPPCAACRRTWDPDNAACGGSCCFLKASEGFTVTNAPGLVSGSY